MKRVLLAVCFFGLCVLKTIAQPCTFTVNAGPDTTICGNQSAYLRGSVNPAAGAYTYQWTPAATLTGATTLNPVATPLDTTVYVLSVTAGGCTATDTMKVNVSGSALVITATVTPALICPKQQVHLTASIIPTLCGSTPACANTNTSLVVGAGNTVQPGTATSPPTLMGNFNNSGRNQMLYTAAELTGALGGACTLKGISFNLSIFNSNAYLQSFTVSVACTNLTSLTTFNNNLVQVVAPSSIQPSAGWNSFAFTNAYNWDGVSNLIVDVCWNNPTLYGNQNNKAQCTNVGFNSLLYAFSNTVDMCGTSVAPTVSQLRPNAKFGFCIPDINNFNILWTPAVGSNAVSSPTISNPTANPVTSQDYTIAVGTGNCLGYKTVNVQVDTSQVSAGPDINSCPGSPVNLTATVVGTVIPGTPSFTWTTLSGTAVGNTQNVTVNPVANTTYVVAMGGGACTHYDTVNVIIGSLNVTTAVTNVKCNGQANGKIVVTASNGTTPYAYTWSANAATGNSATAINLGPGSYSVTVSDVNSCSGTASATVTQPPTLLNSSIVITPIKCFGGNNASITVAPSGGTTPYSYAWSNALPPNAAQTNLFAGNYSLTTTDANGCTVTSVLPITQPAQITFGAAVIQNEKCAGGSTGKITVTPTGGTGAYTYKWSQNINLNSPTASGLIAAAYIVTVTDANACTGTASYTVTQPAAVTFNAPAIVSTKCFGSSDGSATVNPAGGTTPYVYLWSPSNQTTQTATGLSTQTYSVTVTDDSLCTSTTSITIPQPGLIQITGVVSNISCNGANDGLIRITTTTNAVNPITYNWSNAATAQTVTNLSANTYYVTITDVNGCQRSDTFIVTEPPLLVLNAATQVNNLCFSDSKGALTANATGGTGAYIYAWSNAATTQTTNNLAAGPYTVTVTDTKNCTVTATYTITQPATSPTFGNAAVNNVLCNGSATGTITVSVSGGTGAYTYSWSQNGQLNNPAATGLGAGTYTVTATDANGCSVSSSNIITQPAAITFGVSQIINVSCHGGSNGSAQVNPIGGTGGNYTYTWNGVTGTNPEPGLAANTYTVVVTDGNACTASASVVVGQPAAIQDSFTRNNVRCKGGNDGSLIVYAYGGNGPFTYRWADGSTTQKDSMLTAQPAPYSVTITDNNGCTASDAAALTEPPLLTFTHTETQIKCPGDLNGTITAVASGGTPPYNFSVTKDFANFTSTTNGVAMGLDSGLYTIILTDNNGCPKTDTAFIKSPVADLFSITVDSTSCYGAAYADGAIFVTPLTVNNMPYTYTIDNGPSQDSSSFYNLAAGRHQIIATNQFGCPATLDTIVSQPQQGFVVVLPKDTTLSLGQSITLVSGFGPFTSASITSYNWVPSEGLSCVDCPNPVATPYSHISGYVLTIIYNNHCVVADSMNIIVKNTFKPFIPNSFSPNGDGNNDVFEIYGAGIKTVNMRIFNRWGELVFQSTNEFNGWDGYYKGILQNPGVFTYDAQITYLDDTKVEKHGSITLIR